MQQCALRRKAKRSARMSKMLLKTSLILLLLKICTVLSGVSEKGSLTFVIDTTASMTDDIKETVAASVILTETVASNSSRIGNFVLVTFNDPDVDTVIQTKNPVVFMDSLNKLTTFGGGDCAELSMSGIEQALEVSLPGSIIYVFTDASAKDYVKVDRVKSLSQKKQSQVIFLLTGMCGTGDDIDYQVYHEIAAVSSGQVYSLEKHDVGKVLESVPLLTAAKTSVLTAQHIPAGCKNVTFDVDNRIKAVTISASGVEVTVKIYTLTTLKSTKAVSDKNIVNTRDIQIIKLNNLEPGSYTALVCSKIGASVVVSATTDLDFQQGFSDFIPKSIDDTARQPIRGQKCYLSIDLDDPDMNVDMNAVDILDKNELVLYEVPVERVNENLFVTDAFTPPVELFKIAIKCIDKHTGENIRRISKTAIEPQKPELEKLGNKAPEISVKDGASIVANYDDDVTLSCKVSAYPTPNIVWEDSPGNVLPSKFSVIELPYNHINHLKLDRVQRGGKYTCKASNSEGFDSKTVEVKVTSTLNVLESPKDKKVDYGTNDELHCSVESKPPATIKWYFNVEPIENNEYYEISENNTKLSLKNIKTDHIGVYRCKISNEFHEKEFSASISVNGLVPPLLNKTVNEIYTEELSFVYLTCPVLEGKPEPKVTWYLKFNHSTELTEIRHADKNVKMQIYPRHNESVFRCNADNYAGHDYVDFKIIIGHRPEFNRVPEKVETDPGKRVSLQCVVEGSPTPTVQWMRKGSLVRGDKYKIAADNSLSFVADVSDTAEYVCVATNKLGTDKLKVKLNVIDLSETIEEDSYEPPDDYIEEVDEIQIPINDSKLIYCPIHNNPMDDLQWYKDGIPLAEGELYINNASELDTGNYTCIVSNDEDDGSQYYQVSVYVERDCLSMVKDAKLIVWDGISNDMLHCEMDAKFEPKISWIYNGQKINRLNSQECPVTGYGKYRCEVEGDSCKVNKFEVTSERHKPGNMDCLLNTNSIKENAPLILTTSSDWPNLYNDGESIIIPNGEKVKLSCPNKFTRSSQTEVIAICKGGTTFEITDELDFFDLECTGPITSVIETTKKRCLNDGSNVLVKFGFRLEDKFLGVYNVCLDLNTALALYSESHIKPSVDLNGNLKVSEGEWVDISKRIDHNFIYKCASQSYALQIATGNWKWKGEDEDPECCFRKMQMVNARDVDFGPAQRSTFNNFNTLPQWNSCKRMSNWLNLEDRIRSLAALTKTNLKIWTGSSGQLQHLREDNTTIDLNLSDLTAKNKVPVPLYIWKVVKNVNTKRSLAVIFVNMPELSAARVGEYTKCSDICEYVDWMRTIERSNDTYSRGYVYCCNVDSFAKAFNYDSSMFDAATSELEAYPVSIGIRGNFLKEVNMIDAVDAE